MKHLLLFLAALVTVWPSLAPAADPAPQVEKPIRALLVTGGCCHDYARQKLILTRGVSARANVEWTIVHQGGTTTDAKIPLYEDPDWAEGFDVVVHNECFAGVRDEAWVERILKPHREGVPAVLIHCAMHCYRTGTDKWFEFVGVQSPGHGPQFAYTVENLAPEHPIMARFGDRWSTPRGELYHTIKVWPTATPLAQARRQDNNESQVCIWTNQYGKGRVFATTIGHHNETMVEPMYLDTITRGLLWAVGRTDAAAFTPTDAETDAEIRKLTTVPIAAPAANLPSQACCGAGNLALNKLTQASSEEKGKNNLAPKAVDGDLRSRWCASGPQPNQWWQVDLGKPEHVRSLRIHWEANAAYRYKVEASADGQAWSTVVDQAKNDRVQRIAPHEVDAPNTRFLRVTFLGSSSGGWGSFWEFEAYADKLPELPAGISDASSAPASVADVTVAADASQPGAEFNVSLFGVPPRVNYPVCLAAAPTGEVFVGVDEQGSLGREKGRGKVLRCVDVDGDGQADRITEFAKVDHPRGLIYDDGSLWVLHPPFLTVFHDDDRDGVADREQRLLTGISTEQVAQRGADHTTNGIRMGIDGWIYIAVGDFGFAKAEGTDGVTLSRRGGGIVRVRPDGTEMEIFAWGLRNILDVSIDPYLNFFTRDNTNDGGGWNVRLSHVLQSAEYGYPSRYINFPDEIAPPLADFGGGSGCGAMFLHDLRWPELYGNALYTCDWGRSEVYRHNLPAHGPTFDAHQAVFLKIPRPTDIDVDGSGRMYVSSWKDGGFNFSSPNVGFVAQITPKDFLPKPFPDLKAASDEQLVSYLASPSAVHQLHSQRELLRRGVNEERSARLVALASASAQPLFGRVAAIFTLKQLAGAAAHPALVELTKDAEVREWALRALTDRRTQREGVPLEPFLAALRDENPRVRAQALISLGRLGRAEAAEAILPLTAREANNPPPSAEPFHAQPDPGRVIPHLAVRALVALDAAEACIQALDGPHADGALAALRDMHTDAAVEGLIRHLAQVRDSARRQEILTTLIRLYHREGDYRGDDWWGTRPDTSGPYYDRKPWSQSERIAQVVRTAVLDSEPATAEDLRQQLARHKVELNGLPRAADVAAAREDLQTPIAMPAADPNNPHQIANLPIEQALARAEQTPGDAARGKQLFAQQSCVACHTDADGQTPKGPHLVDIGKRYKRAELAESILKPSAKIAQGFDTFSFVTVDGKILTGFVVGESADAVQIRQTNGLALSLKKDEIEERVKQETSMMPLGLANNLTPEQLADLIAYLESLK